MIRAVEAGDLPTLAATAGAWCRGASWMPKPHSAAQDLSFVTRLRARGVWQEIGFPALGVLARRGGDVDALCVAQESQRTGLGRALLAGAVTAADHLHLWTCAANPSALALHTDRGFQKTARTDGHSNDERLPDVRLEWRRHGAAP